MKTENYKDSTSWQGGLGRTHRKEETFPRIADEIGYVDKEDIFELVKAVVATQRDYGNRSDRRRARLKYLIHDWGWKDSVRRWKSILVNPYSPSSLCPHGSIRTISAGMTRETANSFSVCPSKMVELRIMAISVSKTPSGRLLANINSLAVSPPPKPHSLRHSTRVAARH